MADRMIKSGVLLLVLLLGTVLVSSGQSADVRDKDHQPEKVMDVAGVAPGMVIGEVGAGRGYFTFWLARRVGPGGKIYANDILPDALGAIRERCGRENIRNIETILGQVEDPLFPAGRLDMVFLVNAFHDLEKPVELLNNLLPSLKPAAVVVIMDRDPAKISNPNHHFLTKEAVLQKIEQSRFVLDRLETFLPRHNLYFLRPKASRP